MTTFEGCDTEEWTNTNFVYTTFRLVTSAVNMVNYSNTQMNVDEIIDLIGLEVAGFVGGGTTDNATDAIKETQDTFNRIMDACIKSDDANINKFPYINGVRRRPLAFGDPYHWGNLAVMHASKGMAGDTENGEHEQIHHMQCLMNMHSLHSDDAVQSQKVMDMVMTKQKKIVVRTWHERQQRWLVNQLFARRVLAMTTCSEGFGTMCLIDWALYFANQNLSSWKSCVGKEVATWLSMTAIVLGMHFESELGNYFKDIYAWNKRPRPHNTRYGFRMMEIHNLYFDFDLPWWNQFNDSPRLHMPNTYEYLEQNFNGDDFTMRLTLINRGLKAGRDELIKITKNYLYQVTIILLVLFNHKRGPAFLQAVLSVLFENVDRATPQILILDVDNDFRWGQLKYTNSEDQPKYEKYWYNLLTKSDEHINNLIHWWRQFRLNYPVLDKDLQSLSKVSMVGYIVVGEGAHLNKLKSNYPVLFDCLYYVFGTMLSNRHLCEKIHSMMRHGL